MFVPAAMMAMLTSCGDNTVLSAGAAEDAIEMNVLWENPIQVAEFKVGEYTVENLTEVEELQSLANAELITFSKKENEFKQIVATVALTEKGKEYLYEGELLSMREDLLEELNDTTKGNFPEYVTKHLQQELDSINAKDRAEAINANGKLVKFSNEKKDKEAKYHAVNVIIGEIKVAEVKEVRCTEEQAKNGKGSAKVVYEFTDVTPFGIVEGLKDGYKFSTTVNFERYEDLGWVVAKGNE